MTFHLEIEISLYFSLFLAAETGSPRTASSAKLREQNVIPAAISFDRSFVIASEAKQSRQHRFARSLLDRRGGQGRLAMTRHGRQSGQDFWRLVLAFCSSRSRAVLRAPI